MDYKNSLKRTDMPVSILVDIDDTILDMAEAEGRQRPSYETKNMLLVEEIFRSLNG